MVKIRTIDEYIRKYMINAIEGLLMLAIVGIIGAEYYQRHKINQAAKELTPYVELVDGKKGMSITDKLDFGKRANLPQWMINEMPKWGSEFSLSTYSLGQLERALKSYKNQR